MALVNYGVLAGRALQTRAEAGGDSPHFQIQVRAGDVDYRVAVNVLSQQAPSELLYVADESFQHPLLASLPTLADGFTPLPSTPGGMALDFIRANLFDPKAMRPLPADLPGPDNDLADKLGHYVSRSITDPDARIYLFGQRWGPEADVPDKIFGFSPGNGIHDIHMNQGNTGSFRSDDGVWQDGGLLLHFPSQDQWVAIFLAFQSQGWHTDDVTGHTISDPDHRDGRLRIVAALVNPLGPAPEAESVTLVNPGVDTVDLTGWSLTDQLKQRMLLDPYPLPAGDTVRIALRAPVQLGNHGGIVTLLDPAGLKVDGVTYTQEQVSTEGETVVF